MIVTEHTPEQGQARREFDALLRGRPDLNERRLPPFEFDASFPPIAELGWDAGWERVPADFRGPVALVLLGIRMRWVRVRPSPPRPHPEYEFVQASTRYGTPADYGILRESEDPDPMRFRHY